MQVRPLRLGAPGATWVGSRRRRRRAHQVNRRRREWMPHNWGQTKRIQAQWACIRYRSSYFREWRPWAHPEHQRDFPQARPAVHCRYAHSGYNPWTGARSDLQAPTQGDTHVRASRRTSLRRFRKGLLPRATTDANLAACSAGTPPTRPPSATPWCGARVAGRLPTCRSHSRSDRGGCDSCRWRCRKQHPHTFLRHA